MTIEQDILKTLRSIDKHLSNASSTANSLKPKSAGGNSDEKTIKVTVKGMEALNDATNKLEKSFLGLNKTVLNTRASFISLNKEVRRSYKYSSDTKSSASTSGGGKNTDTKATTAFNDKLTKATASGGKFAQMSTQVSGKMAAMKATINKVNNAGIPLAEIFKELGVIITTVINDTYSLLSRGVGAKSLGGLYADSIKSGMSLDEYTGMMANNTPVVVGYKNFDQFNSELTNVTDVLANFGVFGKDAAEAAASSMSTNAKLGVSQADLSKSAISQSKVFEQLRKSTLMTAAEFATLGEEISNSSDVQGHMMGLNESSRAARVEELIQIRALGQSLKATAATSKAFSDALMGQRGISAQERYKAGGYVRQAGAILGMNAADTEELSQLISKRNPTKADAVRIAEIGGADFMPRLEALTDSMGWNGQNLADQMRGLIQSTGTYNTLATAGQVQLEARTGTGQNEELGKAANSLEKAAGYLMTYATGMSKNSVAMGATSILGLIAGGMVGGKMFGMMKEYLSSKFSGASTTVKPTAKPSGKLSAGVDIVKSMFSNLPTAIKSGGEALLGKSKSLFAPISDIFSKILPNALGGALRSIPGVGLLAGFLIDSIGEGITGSVNAAFDPNGENGVLGRFGNMIYAGLTGMIGGWLDLADSVIGLFTDKGLNLRNTWDKFALSVRAGFFNLFASILEAIPFVKDSSWAKSFRESANVADSLLEQLSTDSTLTLADVGNKNKQAKAASAEAKKAGDEASKALSGVVKPINNVVHSAAQLGQEAIKSAQTIAARPAQTTPNSVTQPASVSNEQSENIPNKNTTETKTTTTESNGKTTTKTEDGNVATTTPQFDEALAALKSILDVNTQQRDILESLLRNVRTGATGADASILLNRLSSQI